MDDEGLVSAAEECGGNLLEPYRVLLTHMNGAHLLGVSFHGAIGESVSRVIAGIGRPISIRYQNIIERPDYVPKSHLGIGAINGEWSSQGHLYLSETGEVELYHSRIDLIGARWESLEAFLAEELDRRLAAYDDRGALREGVKLLPGDTGDWERLAEEAKRKAKRDNGVIGRIFGMLPRRNG